jgi:phosphoribosylglycinamide formyltransferase
MVHHVVEEVDQGDVVMEKEIEVYKGDDLEQLRERIQSHEHVLIVQATENVVREILDNGE